MAAQDSINSRQFIKLKILPTKQGNRGRWSELGYPADEEFFEDSAVVATDSKTGNLVGRLEWNEDSMTNIAVHPEYQRQGIGTKLWRTAQQAHKDSPWHYPPPKHSSTRTAAGSAWARTTGDDVPKLDEESPIEQRGI